MCTDVTKKSEEGKVNVQPTEEIKKTAQDTYDIVMVGFKGS